MRKSHGIMLKRSTIGSAARVASHHVRKWYWQLPRQRFGAEDCWL